MNKLLLVAVTTSILLSMFVAAAPLGGADGNIIRVPEDYPTIQAAIDAAQSGDTVLVAPGTYIESIIIKSGVTVQGSGADVTTIQGVRADVGFGYYTVIMGDNSTITGFTITNEATGATKNIGCFYSYNGVSNATITNNIIAGADHGIYVWGASPTIANNIITGAGITGVTVYKGVTPTTAPTIVNNIITNNGGPLYAWWYGGISVSGGAQPTITNNTITGNVGSGIVSRDSLTTITNNIITSNGRYGIDAIGWRVVISYNDVWGNGTNYGHEASSGPSDISVDPLFVDPAAGNYHLQATSPCIDTGDNNAPDLPKTDFDGNPRIVDGNGDGIAVVDMGAFEFQVPIIPVTIDIDPDTLNLESNGKWVTAYIELPVGYDVADIDVASILLQGVVPAELHPTEIGDHDGDGVSDLMVKFNRSAVQALVEPGEVKLTVTGKVGTQNFDGSDTIRVIAP